jgi:hypothetical protein
VDSFNPAHVQSRFLSGEPDESFAATAGMTRRLDAFTLKAGTADPVRGFQRLFAEVPPLFAALPLTPDHACAVPAVTRS